MTEHKYAQALRWLADGKEVLATYREGGEAQFPNDFAGAHVTDAIEGNSGWEFRLKPRTVKIGGREVEAPVLEPEDGQVVFRAVEDEDFAERVEYCKHYRRIAQEGRYFLSGESALAARNAIRALLRGEA